MDYLDDHEGVLPFALKRHGTTQDFNKAGFVLPDGEMLDFSEGTKGIVPAHENVALIAASNSSNAAIEPAGRKA